MSEFHNNNNSSSSNMTNQTTETPSGFSFDNIHRNTMIEQMVKASDNPKSSYLPQATKTGTTIVGLVYKGGVVLGADTRATGGTEVADKNC